MANIFLYLHPLFHCHVYIREQIYILTSELAWYLGYLGRERKSQAESPEWKPTKKKGTRGLGSPVSWSDLRARTCRIGTVIKRVESWIFTIGFLFAPKANSELVILIIFLSLWHNRGPVIRPRFAKFWPVVGGRKPNQVWIWHAYHDPSDLDEFGNINPIGVLKGY